MSQRIVIVGGNGFIGKHLAAAISARGDDVCIITRNVTSWHGAGRAVQWDGRTPGDWTAEIDGADAVVNLAGKNVNCRYTPENLTEINQSRVRAVTLVAEAIAVARHPPRVLVQASTTAIYGDTGDRWCDEDTNPGEGIPPQTATLWERTFNDHPTPQTRRVMLRISFALAADGGALKMLGTMARLFLGGTTGKGNQYISWIHIDDLVRLILRAIDEEQMSGVYVAATEHPVTNAEFMRELRRALHRPWSPPVPPVCVRLGCFLMRTEPVLALTGRRTRPARLLKENFQFSHPTLPDTLASIFGG